MVVWSYGRMVVWSYGRMVVWSYGRMVVWSYGQYIINTTGGGCEGLYLEPSQLHNALHYETLKSCSDFKVKVK
jgi:hypothetical protein